MNLRHLLFIGIIAATSVVSVSAQTVTTDSRFAAGATMAFGRMKISGFNNSDILKQGFCYGTTNNPTVKDGISSSTIGSSGLIYVMSDLTPSTLYYIRGYVMLKDSSVFYGNPVKIYTIPKGTIAWNYDDKGSSDANNRIRTAVETAVNDWNNLASIRGLTLSVHYGANTQTADCSYGGWMRVGPNSSYQSTGTIMHEALHAVGVGTQDVWWNTNMRSNGDRGYWLGIRANRLLNFWDNKTSERLNGDTQHLWPYGCNGAQEDTHSNQLYYAMGLMAEALGEDGLPLVGGTYGTPAYTFEFEDSARYYIKSEDAGHGLYSAYLVDNGSGYLRWKTMTAEEAAAEGSGAAWKVSFTPSDQYYQFKNISTGKYLSYNTTGVNGFRMAETSAPSQNENIHLLPYHLQIALNEEGDSAVIGYYFVHPEPTASPVVLAAANNALTTTATYSLSDASTLQRWIILKEDEAKALEKEGLTVSRAELDSVIAQVRRLEVTPHVENVAGADAGIDSKIESIEENAAASNVTTDNLKAYCDDLRNAALDFLGKVSVSDIEKPFDLTSLILNPDFTADASGWDAATGSPAVNYQEVEFYEENYTLAQTIRNLPAGTYKVSVQGFQRPGSYTDVYNEYTAGTNNVNAQLFAGSKSVNIHNIMDERQKVSLNSTDKKMADGTWIPNQMEGVRQYFNKGLYDNSVITSVATKGGALRIGVRSSSYNNAYWSIFDNFRLYYYGNVSVDELTGIKSLKVLSKDSPLRVYNLAGQQIRINGNSLENLAAGIYIVNGRKIVVK